MSFCIVIAGESQCELLEQACILAEHLSRNLPSFSYRRIEKPVIRWKDWLLQQNIKYKWHHSMSPLIWKELLIKGSKPFYIGGVSEFLEYCHSYYNLDSFINTKKIELLCKNSNQFKYNVLKNEATIEKNIKYIEDTNDVTKFVVCISGANNPLTSNLVSKLLELNNKNIANKRISKIYLYDSSGINDLMQQVAKECFYIATNNKYAVKHISRIGMGLTKSDLLIVLDHVPFNNKVAMGDWLFENKNVMINLAESLNACAAPNLRILFFNLGPSCYNATILISLLRSINPENVVVATSDLGLDIIPLISDVANIPLNNIYCPPVWGFVGINHIVDVRTTIHRFDSFYPNERYSKVENSTLTTGKFVPEIRMLEYLLYNNEEIWLNFAYRENKTIGKKYLNKVVAVVNATLKWLFGPGDNDILNLGVICNGSFGLKFNGVFSQPVKFEAGIWRPASEFALPKDPQVKLHYLEIIAELMLNLNRTELPPITSISPMYTKKKLKITTSSKKHNIRFVE